YQVLTRLAQFSLAREPHVDKVETPKAAVSMAKKTSFVVVVVIMLMTPGMAISVYLIPVWLVVLGIGYLFKEKTAKAVKAH
ncbi:regulatory signaling modulator protein AmpE, partial [Escherichia coli]|nr:regulatory signaling modulator protein AmpE [Escherichia coli]